MGDFEDMAGMIDASNDYLDYGLINAQIGAVEGMIATLMRISLVNSVIQTEINALVACQQKLKEASTALQIRKLRAATLATNLRGGFT